MKYIDLPKPHGFLIWRQKQKAIASPTPLLSGESVAIISEGEAFGEAVLSNPIAVSIKEFERLADEHCIRPEERKLFWPDAKAFYIHRLASWQPYTETKAVCFDNGNCEFDELIEPDESQKALLDKAERLPKTLVLLDNAVVLDGNKASIAEGLDSSKIKPVLDATFDGVDNDASLSLYQLALVRVPKLQLKKKEVEAITMPDDEVVETEPITAPDELETKILAIVDKALSGRKWGDDGTSREEVKAAMKKEGDGEHPASHYLVVEDSEKPTTWHLRVRNAKGEIDHTLMGAAWAALHSGYRGNKYEGPGKAQALTKLTALYKSEDMPTPGSGEKAGRRMAGRMVEKLKNAMGLIQELLGYAEPEEEEDEEEMEGMPEGMMGMFSKKAALAIKQIDGKPWLVTYSTNAFEDREKEIFSTKALEKYVSESERNNDKGYFNLWHIPGTDFAQKEWQAVVGRFLIEAGPFLDNELGQKALDFFTNNPDGHKELAPEGWGCSPEYRYLPEERKSGVYENIWITRTSVLPRLAAANIWTKGSIEMVLSEQQKVAAVKIFGEDLTAQIVKGAEDATKELEQAGVAHKGEPETQPAITVDVDAVAEALAAKFETNMQPYADALQLLGQQVMELQNQFKSFKKSEEVKENTESPRFVFQMKRASELTETALKENDPLLDKKPVETAKKDADSGAAHFFPNG